MSEGEPASTVKDLDKLADTLNATKSIVDSWLVGRKLPAVSRLPSEYTDSSALGRPTRLGIGAKPQATKSGEESIFSNYKLKLQLTGREKLGNEGNAKRTPNIFTEKKRPQSAKPLRPVASNDDADDESRAKSLGRQSDKTPPTPASYEGGRRRKKNKKSF